MQNATTPSPDLADDDIAVLTELRDLVMRVARATTSEIEAAVLPASGVNEAGKATLIHAMTRAARAVRQTIALKKRLAEDRKARADIVRKAQDEADEAHAQAQEEARSEAAAEAGCARKEEAFLLAHDLIGEEAIEDEREDLYNDLREWMWATEYDESYAEMPISEIIEEIKRELQVGPDWQQLTEEVCEYEELRARHEARQLSALEPDHPRLDASDPPADPPDTGPT